LVNFAGLARRIIAVPIHQDSTHSPEAIAAAARRAGISAALGSSIEAALAAIGALELDPPPRILITGSLYLAGEALAANGTFPS
jgi:dihydrofolate synthase/folylpolyglutamate synthase